VPESPELVGVSACPARLTYSQSPTNAITIIPQFPRYASLAATSFGAVAKSSIRSPPTLAVPVSGTLCAPGASCRLGTGLQARRSSVCQVTLLQPCHRFSLHFRGARCTQPASWLTPWCGASLHLARPLGNSLQEIGSPHGHGTPHGADWALAKRQARTSPICYHRPMQVRRDGCEI
jgi:hypothetical protein